MSRCPIGSPAGRLDAGGPADRRGRRGTPSSRPSRQAVATVERWSPAATSARWPAVAATSGRRSSRCPRRPTSCGPETFAPLLYVLSYYELDDAIRLHNDVAQGLSSSIFTLDVREAERFMSAAGSDCGIANVNLGPVRRRDRGRVRWREGDRWRTGVGLGCVEGLHAPYDEHRELLDRAAAGAGRGVPLTSHWRCEDPGRSRRRHVQRTRGPRPRPLRRPVDRPAAP